jgi:hypothetical protein
MLKKHGSTNPMREEAIEAGAAALSFIATAKGG